MLISRAQLLIATLWVGSMWTIGAIVVPMLFSTLSNQALAGTIAGGLFRIEAALSLVCGIVLILLEKIGGKGAGVSCDAKLLWIAIAMLACTVIGYYALQPSMSALREAAGPGGVMHLNSEARTRFSVLHGISSTFYLIQSLLGIALVLRGRH